MFGIDDLVGAAIGPVASGIFSARQASIDRGWQEQQSSTAIQRQMADMAAAGLNPILAGKYGGAPMSGGAMASMPTMDVPGSMVSSAQRAVLEEQKQQTHHLSDKTSSEASVAASEDEIRLATKASEIAATNAANAKDAAQAVLEARDAAFWMKHDDLRALHLQSSNVSSAAEAARSVGGLIGKGLQRLRGVTPGLQGSAKQLESFGRVPSVGSSSIERSPGVLDRSAVRRALQR